MLEGPRGWSAAGLILACTGLSGCLSPTSTICADGTHCPKGTVCDPREEQSGCLDVEEVEACGAEATDGQGCAVSGNVGICVGGVCLYRCGDGVVDADEACDDGARIDGDGCDSTCQVEFCGNGVVDPQVGETCDPGLPPSDCSSNNFDFHGGTLRCSNQCTFDTSECFNIGWQREAISTTGSYHDIYALRADRVVVAGDQSIARYDGESWSILQLSLDDYRGVYMAIDETIYVCGNRPLGQPFVERRSDSGTFEPMLGVDDKLDSAASIFSPDGGATIYVGGKDASSNALILQSTGGAFVGETMNDVALGEVTDIWGNQDALFAVAGNHVLRRTAGGWAIDTTTAETLVAIHGASKDRVAAVTAEGTVLVYNGTSWSESSLPTVPVPRTVSGVWIAPSGYLYVSATLTIAGLPEPDTETQGTVWGLRNGQWFELPIGALLSDSLLIDITGTAEREVIALEEAKSVTTIGGSSVYRFSGTAIYPPERSARKGPLSVTLISPRQWISGDNRAAITDDAGIYLWNGFKWVSPAGGTGAGWGAITGPPGESLFFSRSEVSGSVSSSVWELIDEDTTPTLQEVPLPAPYDARYLSAAYSADSDHLVLGLRSGSYHRLLVGTRSGVTWDWQVSPDVPFLAVREGGFADVIRRLAGTSREEVFAVLPFGRVVRYNGSEWSLLDDLDDGIDPLEITAQGAIIGGRLHITFKNTILRWDGESFVDLQPPLTQIANWVTGSADDDIFIHEFGGRHVHFDGEGWRLVKWPVMVAGNLEVNESAFLVRSGAVDGRQALYGIRFLPW